MADISEPETSGPSGLGLGGIISEKITEQIQNMDVISVLQKMIASTPADEESEEIRQKLQGVIAQFNGLNDEDKAVFTAKIKEGLASKLTAKLTDPNKNYFAGVEDAIQTAVMNQIYLAGAVILVIFILIGMSFSLNIFAFLF